MFYLVDLLQRLFSTSDFVPRSLCGRWPLYLINLHRLGDTIIALSYVLIPAGLFRLYNLYQAQRLDVVALYRHRKVLTIEFAAFIASCGGTHVCQVLVWDWPAYRLFGVWTATCALISIVSAISLWYVVALATIRERVYQPIVSGGDG